MSGHSQSELAALTAPLASMPSTASASASAAATTSNTAPTGSDADASPTHSHGPEQRKASHSAPHALTARSCVTCRRRKVRCDKQFPCSNCTRAGSQCIFPAPGRAPRRPRAGGKATSEREAELLKRLRRLEGVVEDLSGQVEVEAIKHSPSSDNSSIQREGGSSTTDPTSKQTKLRVVGVDAGSGTKKEWIHRAVRIGQGPPKTAFSADEVEMGVGRLVYDEGKSRYVSHPFWSQITDEVEEIREMLQDQGFDSDSDTPIAPSSAVTESRHQSFIMGYNSSDVDLAQLHPLPSQIPFYWQTFLDNVHPLVKILHAPTMTKTIKEVQTNLDSLSKSTEALMFSIYFATITSMNGQEVQTNFGVSKDFLLKQYRFGVEQALARAGLLNTSEIVTVQAFVLFLICVRRHDDTRFVWTLTGLAIRIAQSLGLHRDGAKFGLKPFDIEMRRRLWWQVFILDTRASEDHGADPAILDYTFDTEYPTSCNDEDLDPSATELPSRRPGVSEMTFCLIRYEICSLSRRISYNQLGGIPYRDGPRSMTLEEKEKLVRETASHLEETYLKYCEDAGPLYWVAATVARLITAKISLILYHPLTQPGKPSTLSQDTRDRLLMASIEIFEYSRVLEEESSTKQWGWLFQTYIQWHAIAFILGELCTRPPSVIVDRAWRAVDSIFGTWDARLVQSKSGMLWKPLKTLMAKARRKREENMACTTAVGSNLDLGIPKDYMRPLPLTYPHPMPPIDSRNSPGSQAARNATLTSMDTPVYQEDRAIMEPQIVGMGMLAPDQVQLQFQQQAQQPGQQPMPWLMGDNVLGDLDMNGLESDVSWEGWDDLVRDLQTETGNQPMDMQTGPTLGGMGTWW
ncbi:uncharacterized protein BP5553_02430 [Venustampulla echinocandica]|uniref:Zn(2)-C6 fungal-type domain-containing protein n=1 Tax=Venustampulla echinocandica TaxID=2656787 RepID=A0A370U3U4_9HELO|nr:uncharacterized protein BP5553_02430 [Venustampulla echinocandica]RDL42451.1 hypothetical protein BP5553_02430 [Venustampulla echinocandica]